VFFDPGVGAVVGSVLGQVTPFAASAGSTSHHTWFEDVEA
jgi:hypothetical protein